MYHTPFHWMQFDFQAVAFLCSMTVICNGIFCYLLRTNILSINTHKRISREGVIPLDDVGLDQEMVLKRAQQRFVHQVKNGLEFDGKKGDLTLCFALLFRSNQGRLHTVPIRSKIK